MRYRSIILGFSIGLVALGLVSWGIIKNGHNAAKVLLGLEMTKVRIGDYNLTILVPNYLGRKYYTKPVSIKQAFYISRYEITIAQWNRCFQDGGCSHKAKQRRYQTDSHPVTRVSWIDAYNFTNWLSEKTGNVYRLPTEEEWAYAAFAGKDVTKDTIDTLIDERQAIRTATFSRFRKTREIGGYGTNPWSISDMTGSVWEWTLTCRFSSDEESRKIWTLAQLSDPNLCPNRVVQGDERAHVPYFVDKTYTGGCGTGSPVDHIGFRVVSEARKLESFF
ncbi:MAG: SUMF1/EgtB/PvdO family nonheme iron enzyme [Rhodospirillaceae bacterium]|nr:SUMF1/EgtB/PvdO family nonheme iron enzyme [Rhodospirillaceae bacterium]